MKEKIKKFGEFLLGFGVLIIICFLAFEIWRGFGSVIQSPIGSEIFRALKFYYGFAVIFFLYASAYEIADREDRKFVLIGGLIIVVLFTLMTQGGIGSATCLEPAPAGECDKYANDGFTPTIEQRIANFVFWMTLLYPPIVFGAIMSKHKKKT